MPHRIEYLCSPQTVTPWAQLSLVQRARMLHHQNPRAQDLGHPPMPHVQAARRQVQVHPPGQEGHQLRRPPLQPPLHLDKTGRERLGATEVLDPVGQ